MWALYIELTEVQYNLWNTEKKIVFQTVILQHAQNFTSTQSILWSTSMRINEWESSNNLALLQDMARTYDQYLSIYYQGNSEYHQA